MKLDKKLILNIENIEYKSEKTMTNSSIEDIKKNLDILPFVLKWFQSIDIEKLSINDNIVKIVLNKDILSVENKFFLLDSKIDVLSKEVFLDINNLYLKDYNILFKGKAKIDYFDEELKYFGDIYYQDLIVSGNIDITKDRVNFFIKSEFFKNLHFLKKYLDLPEVANSWMYDNVTGDFKLNWFYGEFDLNKNEIIEKSLQGDAIIENAKIRFENSLEEINTTEPVFVDESQFMMTPVWLNKCPQEYKHIWSQLNESQKSEIYRRASVRIFSTNEDVSTFWNSLNFNQIIESQNVFRRNKPTTLVIENAEDNPRRSIITFSKNLKSNK